MRKRLISNSHNIAKNLGYLIKLRESIEFDLAIFIELVSKIGNELSPKDSSFLYFPKAWFEESKINFCVTFDEAVKEIIEKVNLKKDIELTAEIKERLTTMTALRDFGEITLS